MENGVHRSPRLCSQPLHTIHPWTKVDTTQHGVPETGVPPKGKERPTQRPGCRHCEALTRGRPQLLRCSFLREEGAMDRQVSSPPLQMSQIRVLTGGLSPVSSNAKIFERLAWTEAETKAMLSLSLCPPSHRKCWEQFCLEIVLWSLACFPNSVDARLIIWSFCMSY